YISPVQGSVKGHETVTIYGANFVQPATVQIGSINETVQSVSSDGTTITVTTQPVSGTAPSGAQAVTVTTSLGVATLSAAFTYQESVNPTIYAISPNIGPLEGGTQVTITGIGFQYPVQVLFGTQQAAVISSNYNQVVCTSPSITASAPTTPTTVSVTVTNVGSGQPVSNGYPFQYGQAMFISSIAPGLGPDTGGTTVTITGQGFVSPVAVTFDGVAAQVLSVAGTQIVAKTSALLTRSCSPVSGVVSVTNTGSDTSATGPSWTYTPAKPLITSVVATGCAGAIQNTVPGGQAGCTLTVNGSGFESNMQLAFTNPTITLPENTGATSSTAAVFSLTSSFEGMGIKYNTTTCTNGTENLITAIDVKITDPANGCTNTLTGGLLVSPSNTNCQVTGPLTMTIAPSAASIAGGTTLPFAVNLSRPAQATDGTTMTITISPSANGVIASATSIPLTIAAGQQTATFNVTAGANAGTATITANYGGATATANLTVTTATTGIVFTPSSLNLTAGQGATIGISINPAAATSTNVAVTLIGPSGVIAAPAFPQTVVVPAGGTGSLTITAGSTSGTVTLQGAATGLTTGTATVTVTASAATLTITPANQTLVPG
ncbi:MAG: IPT/TIG domain-containing protein, partial [Smithella sp.]